MDREKRGAPLQNHPKYLGQLIYRWEESRGFLQRILFISAPFGPFFRHASQALSARGHSVWRVVWEGGDFFETPLRQQILFQEETGNEEAFLRKIISGKHINTVITFNDIGRRNKLAVKIAKELNIRRFVLENGYLRPHWVTLDREGINGYSKLPKDPRFYHSADSRVQETVTFPVRMRDHIKNTIKHFAASILLSPILPFDSCYYGDALSRQARYYLKEYCWRIAHSEDYKMGEIVARKSTESARVFVVLMQKPGDAQLRVHSRYRQNRPFLTEVCESFAAYAPANALLVVKQHPYDYGVERLPGFFDNLTRKLGIAGRAYYLRKTSIDIVLDNTDGLITVNSTGGLSAVMRGLPVLCCGQAIFNMDGLTFQDGIDRFWTEAKPPVRGTVDAFVNYLVSHSQINGGFHHPVGIELTVRALTRVITENSLSPHHKSLPAGSRTALLSSAGVVVHSPFPTK